MLTIADRVRSWMESHPVHAGFIADGLLNASALARMLKPELQKQMGEKISQEAITLAINRYGKRTQKIASVNFEQYIGEVSVQSGLSIITIPQVDLDPDGFAKAIMILHKTHEYTLYSRGVWHTALIGKRPIIDELAVHFRHTIIAHDLVAVTVKLKPGHLPVPGVCAYVLQKIALRGINLQEVTSSHDELTLIIQKTDTNKALDCLV
jgi:hypothetical protein